MSRSSDPSVSATLESQFSHPLVTLVDQCEAASEPLLAGGPDPSRFDCAEAWYPLSLVRDLDPLQPTAFTLLDQDLVIWWEPSAQVWRVMEDKCPHRLARLSEGRVSETGYLECPYHGWAFSGSGQCEIIPQSGSEFAVRSPRACIKSMPTAVRQGLLFVYPGQPENAEHVKIPIVDALEDGPEDWVCIDIVRDIPYDALTLLENVMDVSHVSHTHHRTVGNRANASKVDLELTSAGKQGFTGVWAEGPRKGTLGQQNTLFTAPNLMVHDLTSKTFGRTLTVVYAIPIRKGESRLIARLPFKFSSPWPSRVMRFTPIWYSHLSQNFILEDDQIFLHFQERELEAAGGSQRLSKAFYLPTKADLFVSQLHYWLSDFQANPFPGQSLPPALNRDQLLERYHSHVEHCASCQGALANLKKARVGLGALAAVIWTALLASNLLNIDVPGAFSLSTTLLALTCLGVWFALGRLEERFYRGCGIPPRNLPEKSAKSIKKSTVEPVSEIVSKV